MARHDEGHQRQDPALAPVVGAHHKHEVLDGDHQDQRPDDQRQDAQHVGRGHRNAVLAVEALADGVERARADVAVHDPERREGEREQVAAARPLRRRLDGHEQESSRFDPRTLGSEAKRARPPRRRARWGRRPRGRAPGTSRPARDRRPGPEPPSRRRASAPSARPSGSRDPRGSRRRQRPPRSPPGGGSAAPSRLLRARGHRTRAPADVRVLPRCDPMPTGRYAPSRPHPTMTARRSDAVTPASSLPGPSGLFCGERLLLPVGGSASSILMGAMRPGLLGGAWQRKARVAQGKAHRVPAPAEAPELAWRGRASRRTCKNAGSSLANRSAAAGCGAIVESVREGLAERPCRVRTG